LAKKGGSRQGEQRPEGEWKEVGKHPRKGGVVSFRGTSPKRAGKQWIAECRGPEPTGLSGSSKAGNDNKIPEVPSANQENVGAPPTGPRETHP